MRFALDGGLGEQIPVLVFRGDGGGSVEGPGNVQRGVVPTNTAFMFGEPVVGGFVEKVGGIRENDETVGKARWDPELSVVFCAEDFSNPLTASGRVSANVDRDVEHSALGDTNEFSLGTLDLVMEASEDAFGAAAMVILNEVNWVTDGGIEKVFAKGFLKESASVAVNFWFDADDVRNGQAGECHRSAGLVRSRMRYFP